jgi:NADH:ubiquinone oxidoreductase subunit 2 (subunit N)
MASNLKSKQFESVCSPVVWLVVLSPSFILFFLMLISGTVVVFISSRVVGVWLGLELNFLGVVPMMLGKSVFEGEGVIKYFLVQAVGASVLIMGVGFRLYPRWEFTRLSAVVIVVLALLLKIGIYPFCFWVPRVLGLISWFNCFIVMVWQKLGLIWFLSGLGLSHKWLRFLSVLVVLTSVVGGLGGLGVYHYRVLAAYSSLVHVGWMLMVRFVSVVGFLFYWVVYFFIMGGFVWWFYYYGLRSFSDFVYLKRGFVEKLRGGTYFFSLAGLPPFSGVSLKIVGVVLLLENFPVALFFLMIRSALRLYFYRKVFSLMILVDSVGFDLGLGGVFLNLKIVYTSFVLNCFCGFGIVVLFRFF